MSLVPRPWTSRFPMFLKNKTCEADGVVIGELTVTAVESWKAGRKRPLPHLGGAGERLQWSHGSSTWLPCLFMLSVSHPDARGQSGGSTSSGRWAAIKTTCTRGLFRRREEIRGPEIVQEYQPQEGLQEELWNII